MGLKSIEIKDSWWGCQSHQNNCSSPTQQRVGQEFQQKKQHSRFRRPFQTIEEPAQKVSEFKEEKKKFTAVCVGMCDCAHCSMAVVVAVVVAVCVGAAPEGFVCTHGSALGSGFVCGCGGVRVPRVGRMCVSMLLCENACLWWVDA